MSGLPPVAAALGIHRRSYSHYPAYANAHPVHEIVTLLLEHGASANTPDHHGYTPMAYACLINNLDTVQLLSSYGARRSFPPYIFRPGELVPAFHHLLFPRAAEEIAGRAIKAWLVKTQAWKTPLHHVALITGPRALALLRNGATIDQADVLGEPTPLSLAMELEAEGAAPEGSAPALVLLAAAPWRRATHRLFPTEARSYAVQLLLLGHNLSRQLELAAAAQQGMLDPWVDNIMPRLVVREYRDGSSDAGDGSKGDGSKGGSGSGGHDRTCGNDGGKGADSNESGDEKGDGNSCRDHPPSSSPPPSAPPSPPGSDGEEDGEEDGEVHPGEVVEEKISLSERFGLWVSFYPFTQDEYLAIVAQWLHGYGIGEAAIAAARQESLVWALERGSRSGRVAFQFAKDYSGRHAA